MRIVFLPSMVRDIQWFRHFHQSVFAVGSARARAQLRAVQTVLAANLYAGHPGDTGLEVRELSILRTPFTLIDRVMPDRIEVLRLWDMRQGERCGAEVRMGGAGG